MATIRAIASGNWSATSTWNGGGLPGNGDTVYSNGFTVTIDQNITIGGANNPVVNAGSFVSGQWYEITSVGTTSFTGIGASANTVGVVFLATGAGSGTGQALARATISTAANTPAGAVAGGGFAMSSTYNMDCDIRAGTSACLTLSGANNATIANAIIIAGTTANSHAISNTSSGTVTINASSFTTQSGVVAHAVFHNTSTGTLSVNYSPSITSRSGNTSGYGLVNNSNGTISVASSTIFGGSAGLQSQNAIVNVAAGTISVDSSILTGGGGAAQQSYAIQNASTGSIVVTNSTVTAGNGSNGQNISINNASSGTLSISNSTFTAINGVAAVNSVSGTNRFSGTFISSTNGTQPINAPRWILNSSPTTSYIQHALDGINANSFVRFYTADTSLGQANPTDVRSGVSYASGNLTGRLTVPARGSVALSVNYGPSMPFTATRSGTTATATLAYSYPLVVGDEITVTGASNSEWNGSYTIASVVSGTSVTFDVPNTHSATAGTGANMQTTGTAVLDPAAIASAVQSALTTQGFTTARAGNLDNLDTTISSRLAPSGTLATVTTLTNAPASVTASDIWSYATRTTTGGTVDTLTNAPSVPSAATIASQVRTELSVELARIDAATSTRATPANIPTADITAIKAKTDALNTTRLAQVSTTEIVGNLLAQANS